MNNHENLRKPMKTDMFLHMLAGFYRFYLSAGLRTSGTPGQVLKIKKELMKLEHAGRNGGGRNGGGRARVF